MSAMLLRALTLRQLRFLSVLVSEGQFGRAARKLNITQPALSNAIRQMERLIGAELLRHSTHTLELTEIGKEVLARANFLVNTVDEALLDIEGTVLRGRAYVRIGFIPSTTARVTRAACQFLRGQSHDVEFHWRDAPSTTLLSEVSSGQLDVAIAVITEPLSRLSSVKLFRDPLVLVVRRDHPLANGDDVAWASIGTERLVFFQSGSIGTLGEPARALFSPGAQAYRVSHSETVYGMVLSGLALGLMPLMYTSTALDPALVALPLKKPRIERQVALVFRPGPQRNVVVQNLIIYFQNHLGDE